MASRFERLDVFLAVADTGGFTAAARRLGVTPGAVSQAIRALETRLGVLLFARTTRRVALTDAGRALAERLRPVAAEVDDALAAVGRGVAGGRLRLTVPRAVVGPLVAPAMTRLRRAWPGLALEISVSDLPVDLLAEGFDAGLRLGDAVQRDMVAVPLTPPLAWTLAAAPALFDGRPAPASPDALPDWPTIAYRLPGSGQVEPWDLERDGRRLRVQPDGGLVLDDRDLLLAALRDGLGIGLVDRAGIADDVAGGRLVTVLDGWVPDTPGLSLYFPMRSQSQPKLRALIDVLRAVAAEIELPR
ncbi:LysR family transcriptional regulator [Lysobacter humi (ex Lee et al. 2017)]